MKIAIAGLGYVGTANGILLAQNNEVVAFDVCEEKVNRLNSRMSPFPSQNISNFLSNTKLSFRSTISEYDAFYETDYVFIATPTDLVENNNSLDTSSVEKVIQAALEVNPSSFFVIKSTVSIGYTEKIKKIFYKKYNIFTRIFTRRNVPL